MTEFQKLISLYHAGRNILLHGPAGTGKTKTSIDFLHNLKYNEETVFKVLAPTGAAACNLPSGMTIESYFQLMPVDDQIPKQERIDMQIERSTYLPDGVELILIDEISMVGDELITIMDILLRKYYDSSQVFGGVQVIASGDFYQFEPVKQGWCFNTQIWEDLNFEYLPFLEQKRYSCTKTFELLGRLRLGELNNNDKKWLRERQKAFTRGDHNKLGFRPIELYPNKKTVNAINSANLHRINEELFTFIAVDECDCPDTFTKKKQNLYLNQLTDKICSIKVGIPIIFYRNYKISDGLANGTRGTILKINRLDRTVELELDNKKIFTIKQKKYTITGAGWTLSRSQFPIMPAWAGTQSKAQGSTLSHAIVDLDCYYNGQFYTAVSRVVSIDNLYIKKMNFKSIKCSKEVKQYLSRFSQQHDVLI